jgi:hypothetical protein
LTWLIVGGIAAVVLLAIVDQLRSPERESPGTAPAVSTSTEGETLPGPTPATTTESETSATPTTEVVSSLSPRQRIRQTGNQWAPLFAAAHEWAGLLETQPLYERIRCGGPALGPLPNCTPPSPEFRQSFADARVEAIVIKGRQAGARFSNGVTITLVRIADGRWLVHRIGGKAGERLFD